MVPLIISLRQVGRHREMEINCVLGAGKALWRGQDMKGRVKSVLGMKVS
jgi:hypothetical protein